MAKVGKLRLLERRQPGVGVADAVGDGAEEVQLHAAVGHLDEGAVFEALAHQVGLGVAAFEVAADGARLAEVAAVIELEHRHLGERALGAVVGTAVLVLADLDHHLLDAGDALLGDEHLHAARVGRAG